MNNCILLGAYPDQSSSLVDKHRFMSIQALYILNQQGGSGELLMSFLLPHTAKRLDKGYLGTKRRGLTGNYLLFQTVRLGEWVSTSHAKTL